MTEIIRRILVPIDFSEQSDRALRYAAHFALKLGASIELLHVVEDPFLSGAWSTEVYPLNTAQVWDQLVLDARTRLSDCARRLSHLLLGSVAERVLRVAPCAVLTVKSGIAAATHGEGRLVTAMVCEPI